MTPNDRTLRARLAESLEPRSEILEAYLSGSTATSSSGRPTLSAPRAVARRTVHCHMLQGRRTTVQPRIWISLSSR